MLYFPFGAIHSPRCTSDYGLSPKECGANPCSLSPRSSYYPGDSISMLLSYNSGAMQIDSAYMRGNIVLYT